MNHYRLMLILFLFIGCKSKQEIVQNIPEEVRNISCPENGNCTFEVLKNKSLIIKTDAFGKIYPSVEDGDNLVVKYHYQKHQNENEKVLDNNYDEYVYFEIKKTDKQLILKDMELQNVKMVFGRICFCRGSSGYFKVKQGTLYLVHKKNYLQFNLTFSVPKTPQIIKNINESIKY